MESIRDLEKKKPKRMKPPMTSGLEHQAGLRFVQVRQQVKHHQGEQIRAGESVQHLDVACVIQLQSEDRGRAEGDAREKKLDNP